MISRIREHYKWLKQNIGEPHGVLCFCIREHYKWLKLVSTFWDCNAPVIVLENTISDWNWGLLMLPQASFGVLENTISDWNSTKYLTVSGELTY